MPTAKPFGVAEARCWRQRNEPSNHRVPGRKPRRGGLAGRPPGAKGRTIGAVADHIHNLRGMWLKGAGGDVVEKA